MPAPAPLNLNVATAADLQKLPGSGPALATRILDYRQKSGGFKKIEEDMKSVESRYGDDVLNLVIASGYLSKLLGNQRISRYLQKRHPELLNELQAIVAAGSLDQGTTT